MPEYSRFLEEFYLDVSHNCIYAEPTEPVLVSEGGQRTQNGIALGHCAIRYVSYTHPGQKNTIISLEMICDEVKRDNNVK